MTTLIRPNAAYGLVLGTGTLGLLPTLTAEDIEDLEPDALDLLEPELDGGLGDGLDPEEARAAMASLVLEGRKVTRRLASRLLGDDIGVPAFRVAMAADIALRATAAALALLGPFLGTRSREGVAEGVSEQWDYLGDFTRGLETGEVPRDGRVRSRSGMYADSAWKIAMKAELATAVATNLTRARRVLGSARHCGPCIEYADWGWVPIDHVIPIGNTPCRSRCHCWIEYR